MARLLEKILPADRLPAGYSSRDAIPAACWAAVARLVGARNADAARNPVVDRLLRWHSRAPVDPATTGGDGWADDLAELAVGAFFSTVPGSAAAKLIAAGVRVDLATARNFPRRAAVPTGYGVTAEGDPIRVTEGLLATTTLTPGKIAVIALLSREVAGRLGGQAVVEQLVKEEAALALDQFVIGQLLAGVTPSTGSSDPLWNLEAALTAVAEAGGSGPVVAITSPADAARIALARPGLTVPVWPTRAIDGQIVALDPSAVLSAFGPEPLIFASDTGTVHLDSEPIPVAAGAVSASVVHEIFQTDLIAVRCIADVATGMRSGAIAVVSG